MSPMQFPVPAADVLIELTGERLVFVQRANPPFGWALPGGFIEFGETAEVAARREAREETGLDVELESLFNVYSDPLRDPRRHTLSIVYLARAQGSPAAGDDAAEARAFAPDEIPGNLAFDHHRILADYLRYRHYREWPGLGTGRTHPLTSEERATLLAIARSAIAAKVGAGPTAPTPPCGRLGKPGAAFVSLHLGGALRGCIGNLAFDRPLHEVVREIAVAAAFEDPRFPPLQAEEYAAGLTVEVSVLSRPEPSPVDLVVAGWHGVSLSARGRKAVFLPQVAREEGWSRRTLLEQLAVKAGLDVDAWRDADAELETFTSEIVAEER